MDQNSVLTEDMATKPVNDKQVIMENNNLYTKSLLIPEVSNLIESVNKLANHNSELLKMAQLPSSDIGSGRAKSSMYFESLDLIFRPRTSRKAFLDHK